MVEVEDQAWHNIQMFVIFVYIGNTARIQCGNDWGLS